MKKNSGSVAPKERINIVYKPSDSDSKEKIELPLRLMVLSDLTSEEDERSVSEREVMTINKKNFDSIIKKSNVSVKTHVDNVSGNSGEPLEVNLKINSIADFSPDNIAQNVPEVKRMLDIRESLVALKGPIGNSSSFRKAIQQKLSDPSEVEGLKKTLKIEG
jgi:type VI secretion system protein ImpB